MKTTDLNKVTKEKIKQEIFNWLNTTKNIVLDSSDLETTINDLDLLEEDLTELSNHIETYFGFYNMIHLEELYRTKNTNIKNLINFFFKEIR